MAMAVVVAILASVAPTAAIAISVVAAFMTMHLIAVTPFVAGVGPIVVIIVTPITVAAKR